MKRFRYSMQSLLVIKQKMEDQAKAAYAAAKLRLNEEERKLADLQEKREGYVESKKEVLSARLNVPLLNRLQTAIETTDGEIMKQRQNVKKAEMAMKVAEERLVNSMTERKTQEKLRENAFEEYRLSMNSEEQKEIDERTGFTYYSGDSEEKHGEK